MMKIQVKIIDAEYYRQKGIMPSYATPESAGMDLRTMKDFVLPSTEQMLIPTGLAIHINNAEICACILPRSGLGHKEGIILGNTVGLIDSDYQQELLLSVWNRGHTTRYFSRGDRIAQIVFLPIIRVALEVVDTFETASKRGGFGSTGVI